MSNPALCLYFFIKNDMKKITKVAMIFSLSLMFLGAFRTYASTGATTTGIAYTGVISNYLKANKQAINTLFDETYAKVYAKVSQT